jgi:hypothetical protein
MGELNWIAKSKAIECVMVEPELPGDIPEDMYQAIINGDREFVTLALRTVVKKTKEGIIDRIMEA